MTIEPTMDDQEGGGAAARLRQNFIFRTIVRRLLLGLLTLFLVSIVVFVATQLLPGDPARAVLGRDATPDRLAAFRREFHLNQSALAQYWSWISGLAGGDTGTSLANGLPVWSSV